MASIGSNGAVQNLKIASSVLQLSYRKAKLSRERMWRNVGWVSSELEKKGN